MLDYSKVPNPAMIDGLKLYVENRIKPGHFLTALLANDFVGIFTTADHTNLACMREWAGFLYNEMPARSHGILWGSYEVIMKHLNGGQEDNED